MDQTKTYEVFFFLYLQDRSLDFHALCALYAVTGTYLSYLYSPSSSFVSNPIVTNLDVNLNSRYFMYQSRCLRTM